MSELLTDAKFSLLDLSDSLYINNSLTINKDKVLYVNEIYTNIIHYTYLKYEKDTESVSSNTKSFPHARNELPNPDISKVDHNIILSIQGINNVSYNDSVTIGGNQNEAIGKFSTCVGGNDNEANGSCSTTIGGSDNQSIGENSISCGKNSICIHDTSFVFNSSNESLKSTMDSQFIVGADNGLMFRLPLSTTMRTDTIIEGFAVWCWDTHTNSLCLKTKQNNTLFKTNLETLKHELTLSLDENGLFSLNNPDDS
jgi:hypothetical protein